MRLDRGRASRAIGRAAGTWRGPRQGYVGFFLVAPIFVFFVAFKFQPIARAILLSFTNANPFNAKFDYVGLENYFRLARDPQFINSVTVTAYYVVGSVLPIVALSLGLALLLNERIRGIGLYRILTLFPAIIPFIVVPVLWQFMLHPYGLVNVGIESLGLPPVNWLRDQAAVIPAIILASDWRLVPLFSIVYFAGLQSIPEDLYEAAKVDGASRLKRFRWITLPMLRPTMLVVVILASIFNVKGFTLAFVLTGGGPADASRILPLFIYKTAFEYFRVGYASAASIVLLGAMVLLTVVNLRLFRSDD